MRSKRQTVWLVSMLSLMVVLSAYYLFTEDTGNVTLPVADGQQVTSLQGDPAQTASIENETTDLTDVIVSEITTDGSSKEILPDSEDQVATNENPSTDQVATTQTPATTEGTSVKENAGKMDVSAKDEDVLKTIETQGSTGYDMVTSYQFSRAEQNAKTQDRLMQAIDSKSLDEATKAQKELNALEEKESIIMNIEEQLQQQYANAVVTEKDNQYKVVVVSEQLEAKQAVGIMDLVMKELGISQDKIKVQYVTTIKEA